MDEKRLEAAGIDYKILENYSQWLDNKGGAEG